MNVRNRKGQSIIEFALIMPLLLLLVFGIVDFSIGLYDKAVVTNASREGARAGIVYRYPALDTVQLAAEARTVAQNYCSTYLITFSGGPIVPPNVAVSGGTVGGFAASGQPLTVTVTYNYTYLIIPRFIGGGSPTLTATTVMRME
jgi:Flp pilus assembly protein TadG